MIFTDKVVLVNSADEAVGEMDKLAAHHYPLQRHRAVSVWLFRSQKSIFGPKKVEILFQQRSRQKIVGALWWGNTICGNVFPGETYEECAVRRLKAELAIEGADMQPVYKFEYQAFANDQYGEHEVDQVFVGKYEGSVVPQPEEVKEILWVDLEELKEHVDVWRRANPSYPTAVSSLAIKEEELRKFTPPVVLKLADREILMVPWTMMMLLDERLWRVF